MISKIEISIILPIRNESYFIRKTLNSILNQDTNRIFEIIIADGMSTDNTLEIINDFKQNHIKIVKNHEKIVSTGFNLALNEARGGIIIRIDGHATIEKDFIEKCLEAFNKSNADCVGGLISNSAQGSIGTAINYAQSSKFGVGSALFRQNIIDGRFVDTLAFGAYKRNTFVNIGGYDEELVRNQDDEFNFRLIQNGGKIWLDPSIKSTYYPRNSLLKLFKQYFHYGFFKIRVIQKRRGFASWRHLVPLFFVLILLLCSYYYFFIKWPFVLVLSTYLSANLLATGFTLLNKPKTLLTIIALPIAYLSMHISYGVGFLFGIIYFIGKWKNNALIDIHFNKELFLLNTK